MLRVYFMDMSERFWWRKARNSRIEALEMKASIGNPGSGSPPRKLWFQIAWIGEDGRRKIIGHMNEAGKYEPKKWMGKFTKHHADPLVAELLRELSGLIVTSQVMES